MGKKSKKVSTKKPQTVQKPNSMKKKKIAQKQLADSRKSNQSPKKVKEKRKKNKKEVDPNKPKLPQSGYFLWMNEKGRNSALKANPDIKYKEVIALVGAKWKEMSNSQKKPYNDRYIKSKAEYVVELEK